MNVSWPIQLRLDPLRFHQEGVCSLLATSHVVFSAALVCGSVSQLNESLIASLHSEVVCLTCCLRTAGTDLGLHDKPWKPSREGALFAATVTPGPRSASWTLLPSSSAAGPQLCQSLPSWDRCTVLPCPGAPPARFLC